MWLEDRVACEVVNSLVKRRSEERGTHLLSTCPGLFRESMCGILFAGFIIQHIILHLQLANMELLF